MKKPETNKIILIMCHQVKTQLIIVLRNTITSYLENLLIF